MTGCIYWVNNLAARHMSMRLRAGKCCYEMRAASGWGWGFTAARGCRGRMSANPTRKIAKAVRIPNAIAPNEAQINIAKSSKFVTATANGLDAHHPWEAKAPMILLDLCGAHSTSLRAGSKSVPFQNTFSISFFAKL